MVRANNSNQLIHLLKKALFFSAFFYVLGFFCAPVALARDCPPQWIDEAARVNYVYDGDTLQLESGRKVRLLGIDTPEIHSRKHAIPADIKASGQRARSALQSMLNSASGKIQLAYGQQRFDRYGRALAHVFLPDGSNLQAGLIAQGYAVAFTTPPNDRMSDCYRQQEIAARNAQLGIWQLPQYQLQSIHQPELWHTGFQRIQGKVTEVTKTASRIRLRMGDRLEINIYKNDWSNFSLHWLNGLQNKTIRVRGWLSVNRKQSASSQRRPVYRINVRHPDAMTEDTSTK